MTREETKAMLTLITVNYPYTFKGVSTGEKKLVVDTWHNVFCEYDSLTVRYALAECFKTSRYAPNIADVLGMIRTITNEYTDEDDWKIACSLVRKGNWLTKEEWENTPKHIRKWFGSMSAVRELANQESETLQTVTRGQFMKTIGAIREDCKIQEQMPEEIKQLAEKLGGTNENHDTRNTTKHEQIQRQNQLMGIPE